MQRSDLRLDRGVVTPGGVEERHHCPFCVERGKGPDREGKFYLHVCGGKCEKCRFKGKNLTGMYRCWRCGVRGSISSGEAQDKPIYNWKDDLKSIAFRQGLKSIDGVVLPEVCQLVPGMQAYDYLLNRGITSDQIHRYGMCLGMGSYSGRVVIPDLDEQGRWLYWVGRDYTNTSKLKYKSPTAEECPGYSRVFNLRRAGPEVQVCEGIFSAIAVGLTTVATYGKDVSAHQVLAMKAQGVRHAVCLLDGDAYKWNLELGLLFQRYGISSSVAMLPKNKDPAELPKSETADTLRAAFKPTLRNEIEARLRYLVH